MFRDKKITQEVRQGAQSLAELSGEAFWFGGKAGGPVTLTTGHKRTGFESSAGIE